MTHIIATIGPATQTKEKVSELIAGGVNFFRLNFSHGDYAWHKKMITLLREVSPDTPIVLDTKGPEMRLGDMPEIFVPTGSTFDMVIDKKKAKYDDPENFALFVNYKGLPADVEKGDIISLDSGLIEVQVKSVASDAQKISVYVISGGKLTSHRHVNLVKKDISLPTITEQDEKDIRFGLQNGVDIIALSFLRDGEGVKTVRKICEEEFRHEVKIWGKIESQKGVDNIESLGDVLDGMMVARGDLGVETPIEEVPYRQRDILAVCKKKEIFSIVATEMLESMIVHPRPTRAEVSDVALAVWEGANAVMLSGETASGLYPIESVKMMNKVVVRAEKSGVVV